MTLHITEGYVPGSIGRIAQLHGAYYAQSNGFGVQFEAKVASELSEFCMSYMQGRDGFWLARDGQQAGDMGLATIEGSIVLDGRLDAEGRAHLRWFITSDATRGNGVGRQLLERALAFSDAQGYESVYLWTFAGLTAARHLYEACGFELVYESPGARWGKTVLEQQFERKRPRV